MSKDRAGGDAYRVEYPMNVVLTRCKFNCTKCKRWLPAARFGLRDDNGTIRQQPQCMDCRRGKKKTKASSKLRLVK